MSRYTLGVVILRIIIPILIGFAVSIRPSVMSLIYLALLCYLPFLNLIDERDIDTSTFKYVMIFLPYQTAATQFGFFLYSSSSNELDLPEHDSLRRLLKNIGLSRLYNNASVTDYVCWLGPEFTMVIVSVVYMFAVRMMARPGAEASRNEEEEDELRQEKLKYLKFSVSAGKFLLLCLLLMAALWRHSLFGIFYFALFLFFMTCWSFDKNLPRLLSIVLFFCMPVSLLHTVAVNAYQIEWLQDTVKPNNTVLRYLGIDVLIEVGPTHGSNFTYYKYNTDNILVLSNPVIVYLLYYFMVLVGIMLRTLEQQLKIEKKKPAKSGWRRLGMKVKKIVRGKDTRETPRTAFLFTLPDRRMNKTYDKIMNFIETVAALIVRYSYVGSIVIIMIWSVTFLNMTSFVLLIWGIILWMVPNQKRVTEYSVMVILVFCYGNMTFSYLQGLDEVSFYEYVWSGSKLSVFKFMELSRLETMEIFVKVMYTTMFWVTIRQYMQERHDSQKERIGLERSSMFGRSDFEIIRKKKGLAALIERILKHILVRYFIVLIAVCLFVSAITGVKMNVFRISSMFMYLLFMVVLQISFRLFRRVIFVFMLFIVLFSFINMMVAYLYEFEAFDQFLLSIGITEDMHDDFGINHIDSRREYMNRIIAPTTYIVLCLIQLTFFHDSFLTVTDPMNIEIAMEEDEEFELAGPQTQRWLKYMEHFTLFLEQHLLKLVNLALFLMCVLDKCALYFSIVAPLCISLIMGRRCQQYVVYYAALIVSIHSMLRMIYALSFFQEEDYNVTCNVTKNPEVKQSTRNVALWIGFWKYKHQEVSLFMYLLWPTMFVMVSSIWTAVTAKWFIYRSQRMLPTELPKVVFPDITYKEADLSLTNYIKYAINYGFYRLGYEMTLIAITAVIVLRVDGISIIYSGWLCILLVLPRFILRYTWCIFVVFIALSIPFQYVMAIGFPPHWCWEYEWERGGSYWLALQDFWFLVDNYHPPPIYKLFSEFVLLMIASNQMRNFFTEMQYRRSGKDYEGGSNDSIIKNFEKPGFVNPLPDFQTYTTSYLDMFKRVYFNFSYWGSMWIVFLGSVNRSNLFSIVYLFFVFTYIWFGINLYYQPLRVIVKYWNHLIGQNVFILVAKTSLQLVGCFYLHLIPKFYCPLVKLLAIGCVRRFDKVGKFKQNEEQNVCASSENELFGIGWDAAIFAFLILQKRAFSSYNFFHIIDDAKASQVLSRRGAVLLGEMEEKEIQAIIDEKARVSERIAAKLRRVQTIQRKIQGEWYNTKPFNHKMAIRQADYYMFEDIYNDVEIRYFDGDKEEEPSQQRNIISLISDMFEYNMRYAVRNYWTQQQMSQTVNVDEDEPYGFFIKVLYLFRFIWALIDVIITSATNGLSQYTKKYDYINKILETEKRELKEKTDYAVGVRQEGWWLPRASYESLLKNSKLEKPKKPPREMSTGERSDVMQLVIVIIHIMIAKSDQLCFLLVILNQILLAELIIIPQAIMVFFWGSLSNPRPSKTFWIIMIGYVELTILLKCIFQFDIMPGNTMRRKVYYQTKMYRPNPFYPPRLLGLYRSDFYYLGEMFTLIAIIMHRTYLKSMGLWTSLKSVSVKLEGDYVVEGRLLVPADQAAGGSRADRTLNVQSMKQSVLDNIVQCVYIIFIKYGESFKEFYQRLFLHVSQKPVDLYTVMFWCDLITMFIITFGYPNFFNVDEGDSVASFFTSNTIPVRFVCLVFFHFFCMFIDRCIYLKRNVMAKLAFQVLQIIMLHLWLFIIFPILTNGRQVNDDYVPICYYVFRCFYLLISAYQIRCGYTSRIWGIYCTHQFYVNNYLQFLFYLLLPFLFEFRTILDWMLTDTALSLFDYFKMEDMYKTVYIIRCQRQYEDDYFDPPYLPRKHVYKYFWAGLIVFIIIMVIWFPILLYSFGRQAGTPNIPSSAKLSLSVEKVEPLYENDAKVYTLCNDDYDTVKTTYNAFSVSQQFLEKYDHRDVAGLAFDTGGQKWLVRQQLRNRLLSMLNGAHPIQFTLKYSIILLPPDETGETRTIEQTYDTPIYPHSTERQNLMRMIEGDTSLPAIKIPYIVPKFLKVEQRGRATPVDILMREIPDERASSKRNLTLSVRSTGGNIWWELKEDTTDYNFDHILDKLPYGDAQGTIVIYTFSDRVVKVFLFQFLAGGGGILALYSLYFFVCQEFFRDITIEGVEQIWMDEMDLEAIVRYHDLARDVYLCREHKNYAAEELAFAKLSFAFRSQEVSLWLLKEV